MYDKNIMKNCSCLAGTTCSHKIGGPFGAAVVRKGKVISISYNTVLGSNDPTAHAEINAIRSASNKLVSYDLSDCELYATGYPCPMCLGAIMWAGIKKVYVSGHVEDAESIGFKDKFIYDTIDNIKNSCYNKDVLDIEFHDRDIALELYNQYKEMNGVIY